ncbi:disease resistance protein RPM1-like [Magnolia sinica]|uniref:disease resistance protein RPM1-like n=1 Tax=Magnolia sinica TaxID=86752 RepID=UPI002658C2BB|nr:disease resistance protein RPM1-like [Magnolia sinica]
MGGLGKTTLARKVYDSERLKIAHFQAFVWSQTFIIENIFRSILMQICRVSKEEAKSMNKDELIENMRVHLQQKRYVIVLDDLWKVDDCKCIRVGLPDDECVSRIMVTSCKSEVAAACVQTSDHVYNLSPLSPEESWALFCKKALQYDLGGNCPPHLKQISETFMQKCGGLPLSIEAIGSLLWTKNKTLPEWQKLYNSLGLQIETSDSLTSMNQILSLSYNDFPYYLKTCFIYVSIFLEDYLIKPMTLIQLCIAEAFVEKKKEGITLDKLAYDYLHELVNRSLIQAASYTDYGALKTCCVHDVVREIILSKAREEKFLTFQSGGKVNDKTRRLTLHDHGEISPENDLLLKVLDLEDTGIDEFSSEIVNLFHLRYTVALSTQWIANNITPTLRDSEESTETCTIS